MNKSKMCEWVQNYVLPNSKPFSLCLLDSLTGNSDLKTFANLLQMLRVFISLAI